MSVSSVSVLLMNGSSSSWWNLGLFDTSFVRLSERDQERRKERGCRSMGFAKFKCGGFDRIEEFGNKHEVSR